MLLIRKPMLTYPDFLLQYMLDIVASNIAVGVVLSQMVEGEVRVVVYYSKMFSPPQQNYCMTGKELLAVVIATKDF